MPYDDLQGLKGWTDSLKYYKDLTEKAEQYPLKASQIFSRYGATLSGTDAVLLE